MLNIVADENIPLVENFFQPLGQVTRVPGRELSAAQVRDADVLLVRSVTRVDDKLLAGSRVRFVGTCTIGTDHLDSACLAQRGIAWANAPGCNAEAVVQYVFSVLAVLQPEWLQATVGIIGAGNVGGRLYRRLRQLGVSCRVYDPFLSPDQVPDLASLEAVLAADVVCVHAPLTREGDHPSWHLLDAERLQRLAPGALLISAGRGAVVDNAALLQCLEDGTGPRVALDVWEPEPDIDPRLLARVAMATPHIAGYSYDGRVTGTAMIYAALCRHLGRPEPGDVQALVRQQLQDVRVLYSRGENNQARLNQAILAAYDVREDDLALRTLLRTGADNLGPGFDLLRKTYGRRREFSGFRIDGLDTEDSQAAILRRQLTVLGFGL